MVVGHGTVVVEPLVPGAVDVGGADEVVAPGTDEGGTGAVEVVVAPGTDEGGTVVVEQVSNG
ncbi:MAG: hypothetical protein JO086_12110 [Acidimicrobiia bacterium]|nr:hypothetical protein [Acidimicrobiia bacterium]